MTYIENLAKLCSSTLSKHCVVKDSFTLKHFRKYPQENTCTDCFKIVFLWNSWVWDFYYTVVDKLAAWVNYYTKVNKLCFFVVEFPKRNGKHVLPSSRSLGELKKKNVETLSCRSRSISHSSKHSLMFLSLD